MNLISTSTMVTVVADKKDINKYRVGMKLRNLRDLMTSEPMPYDAIIKKIEISEFILLLQCEKVYV